MSGIVDRSLKIAALQGMKANSTECPGNPWRQNRMSESKPDSKVLFRVESDDGGVEVETLWATNLENDRYKLDNSPFYAYSVSWEDIVLAPWSEEEKFPTFERVVEKSGNRTIRVVFDMPVDDGNESDRILQGLVELGCSYEGASRSYICINIPPAVKLESVADYLIGAGVSWEHADPCYDEIYPGEARR